jgi:hypothetical protein
MRAPLQVCARPLSVLFVPACKVRPFDVIGGLLVTGTGQRENPRTGVREPILTLDSGAELAFPDPGEIVKVTGRRKA